jgi:hypothetical protein
MAPVFFEYISESILLNVFDEGLIVEGGCLEDEDADDEDRRTNGLRRNLIQQPPARTEHRGLLKASKLE